jgi:murein DD-endopeptidase MepM/ murein hydrolase activator NlpD
MTTSNATLRRTAILCLPLAAGLAACSVGTPAPTPIPTATSSPTITLTPSPSATATPTPTPTFPVDAVPEVGALNLRAGPDVMHPVLGGIGPGTPMAIGGRDEAGTWFAVRLPDDSAGWVNAGLVTLRRAYDTIPTAPTPSPPPSPTRTPAALDPALPVVLAPPVVARGDPFLVRLRAPGAAQAVASLGEAQAGLFPAGPDTFAGLLGASTDMAPGEHVVHVTVVGPAGDATPMEAALRVVDAVYPEQSLTFDQQTASLLDPVLRQAELDRLASVWSVVTPEKLWQGTWTRPVTGTVSSGFGSLRAYQGSDLVNRHTGADFRAGTGTPVTAPARGRVALAEALAARGNTVWLDHGWGLYSGYFHLAEIGVAPGDTVERGQRLGTVGATGLTTGPHLHWETRVQGVPVQPIQFLLRDLGAAP